MYIFELISKIRNNLKKKKQIEIDTDLDVCSHVFAPLDSTNKHFACTKCGFVAEKSELEAKNFFVQEN